MNEWLYPFTVPITRWSSWTRLITYIQITNNILGHWDRHRERERERERENGDGETYLYTWNQRQYSRIRIETFGGKREWAIRIKRCTLTPTMSDDIGGHCFTHSETKKDKEIPIKRRTYTCRFTNNIPGDWDREKLRWREVPIHVQSYSQWQYIRTQMEAFTERKWERHTDQET